MSILVYNRKSKQMMEEAVYGENYIRWFYKSSFGQLFSLILTSKWLSQMYGLLQSSKSSAKKIPSFIDKFQINMDQFQHDSSLKFGYTSFNAFFIRKFKENMRPFSSIKNELSAFAEARYFALSTSSSGNEVRQIPIKGIWLTPDELISSPNKWNLVFKNGPILLARLCPVDYHRYHYPDDGVVLDSYTIHGRLDSVNPIAFEADPKILLKNERRVTIFETKNFKKMAYIEVGATCVGKIIQTHLDLKFKKGMEKGYFLFGGSTVVVIGEPGAFTPSFDMIENTKNGIETYVELGDVIATTEL